MEDISWEGSLTLRTIKWIWIIFGCSVPIPQSKNWVFIIKTNQLLLHRGILRFLQYHTKHVTALWVKNVDSVIINDVVVR